MCGICGISNTEQNETLKNAVKRSLDSLIHRGPDDWGIHQWEQCCMGMRRLSIIDLSGGHQPIFNEDRSMAIVFNGEIYNYKELRSLTEKRGHVFHSESDTEVILHLYEEFGDNMLDYLRGMYAIAIWNDTT